MSGVLCSHSEGGLIGMKARYPEAFKLMTYECEAARSAKRSGIPAMG